MNRDEIIRMARKAGFNVGTAPQIERFASLVAAAERERMEGKTFWLWRNGNHYLAFEHEYPCYSPGGDPMVLGEPAAVAVFRGSHDRAKGRE